MQVLAEARRIVDIMDREDGQRRRTANSDSRAFAAATALYSMAHKVLTHAAGSLGPGPGPLGCVMAEIYL